MDSSDTKHHAPALLSIQNLTVALPTGGDRAFAVKDISFELHPNEILCIVGESGSGKSVTGLAIMGLIDPPGRVVHGSIKIKGHELVGCTDRELSRLRGKDVAMIFQDPMNTLHPLLRLDTQIVEAILTHQKMSHQRANEMAIDALRKVGIPAPEQRMLAYPHQLSGGMRQRVAIAIALLHRPAVLVADEPTTALDVTLQSQILGEVQQLCADLGTALIWVTHDLAVVAGLADSIAVMYGGRLVEQGSVDQVLDTPLHPYTVGLLASSPSRNKRGQPLSQIPGMTSATANQAIGCAFSPRCAASTEACTKNKPDLQTYGTDHTYRCFHPVLMKGYSE